MRKCHSIMYGFLLSLILIFPLIAGNYQFSNQQTGFFLVNQSGAEVEIGANMSNIFVSSIEEEGTLFDRIIIPGYHFSMVDGYPEVPVMNKFIEVPFGDVVNINLIRYDETRYSARELGIINPVYPHQPPKSKSVDEHPFVYNEDAYRVNSFGDEMGMVRVVETVISRGVRLALIQFRPVSYNPVTKEVKVRSNVHFEINVDHADLGKSMIKSDRYSNVYFNSIIDDRVLRTGIAPKDDLTGDPIGYLIICADEFIENARLADFIDWKIQKGFHVELLSRTDAGSTNTGIKATIQDRYDNAAIPPSFVLLIGDSDNMPTNNGLAGGHVTDKHYAMLEGTDDVTDLYIGRFSASSDAELEVQIDKTLMYEQYTMPDPSYLDEVMGTAGWDSGYAVSHGHPQINYFDVYYSTPSGWTMYKYLTTAAHQFEPEIIGHVSDGVAFYNYTAHCSPSGMADPTFVSSDIPGLQNDGKYGLLIGNCCSSNEFQQNSPDCFGEQLLTTANKGAVGYIGGSNSTYWDEDLWYGVGYYANITGTGDAPPIDETGIGAYDGVFTEGYITNEAMNYAGLLAVEESTSPRKQYYWEIYHIMGDPSVSSYFGQAEEISAIYNDALFIGASSFDVAVPGKSNALVSITMNGEILGTAFTDESGNATINFNELVSEVGTANVTVTAQGMQPVIESVPVIVPASVLFDPASVVINTATDVLVTVTDDSELPMEGVNIWAVGVNYATTPVATDASGQATININYPYGPEVTVIGKRPADSYNLFTEALSVTGGLDYSSADFSVSTTFGLSDTFAIWLPGTVSLLVDPAADAYYQQINDGEPENLLSPGFEMTPEELGEITYLAVKDGYNVYSEIFPVIQAYGTISGTLTEAELKGPIADTEIRFYEQNADIESVDPVFTATTDAGGAYVVGAEQQVGYYDIYIDKFGYEAYVEAGYFLNYGANVHDMVMDFAASGVISGVVSDGMGTNLSANIKIYRSDNNELYRELNSEGDGSYTVTLPNFTYEFKVKTPGYKLLSQDVVVSGDATVDFTLELTSGILIVDDDAGKWLNTIKEGGKESESGSESGTKASESTDAFEATFASYGISEYTVETISETDPETWFDYDLVIWSSGDNEGPVVGMTDALVSYVSGGGLLLIEGGEINYDQQSNSAFMSTVLHVTDWSHDNSGTAITLSDAGHPIAIAPFAMSSSVAFSYSAYGDADSGPMASDADMVFGWGDYPTLPSVLAFNNQIVFYSFNLLSLDNSNEDRDHLIMNSLAYLGAWSPGGMGSLSGTVTADGSPLSGVTVSVNDGAYSTVSGGDGSYSIDLYPGDYEVSAVSDTYYPFIISHDSVHVSPETATELDFGFETVVPGKISGHVTLDGMDIYSGVEISIPALDLSAISGEDGSYELLEVMPGAGLVMALREGFGTCVQEYFLVNGDSLVIDFNMVPGYEEDFEAENGGYTETGGLWAHGAPSTPPGTGSGINVWGTNLTGDYSNSADASLYSVPLYLNYTDVRLTFSHWYEFEGQTTHYDGGNVKISTDGGSSWSLLTPEGGYGGTIYSTNSGLAGEEAFVYEHKSWHEVEFDLSAYAGEEVILRWHFGSDGSVVRDGWYIDDVSINFSGLTDVEVPLNVAYSNALLENYPNPFNPATTIPFSIKQSREVQLVIYNMLGQEVRRFEMGRMEAGAHHVMWDARDNHGQVVASGVYLYRLTAGDFISTRKMLFLK